jgi:Fuc2NAc and GlcNAc transferase
MSPGTDVAALSKSLAGVPAMVLSALLTGWLRRYALQKEILDHPNERSSHVTATPRGGGAAIVAITLAGFATAAMLGMIPPIKAAALIAGGLLVAFVGWWDDRWTLSSSRRFLAHLAGSGLAVYALGPIESVVIGKWHLQLGWAGAALAVFGITALINITNFMDGIDGIAGSEGAFVCAAIALLAGGSLAFVALITAAACCGFLLWNWPPAKIFMGDVGSGFLGYAMCVLILWGRQNNPLMFWGLAILPSAFVADGATTLLYRMATGQDWLQAHRNHAYQHGGIRWGHRAVDLVFLALNVGFALPMAWLAMLYPQWGAGFLALVLAPLSLAALALGAGKPSKKITKAYET